MMADEYIWVVTDLVPTVTEIETDDEDDYEVVGDRGAPIPRNPFPSNDLKSLPNRPGIPVSVEKLEQGVDDFLGTMGRVLKKAQAKAGEIGGMELDEIQLSVEVNGEGQLSLLGSGTKVGGSGALTLTFKRDSKSDTATNTKSDE